MYYIFSKRVQKILFIQKLSKTVSLFSVFVRYSSVFWYQYQKLSIEKKFKSFFRIFLVHLGVFVISGISKISVIPFNTIAYWKCPIPKFQYYWILKMSNTKISILLNTEDGQYRIFNTIEIEKISIPNFNNTENYFQYFSRPYSSIKSVVLFIAHIQHKSK